MTGPRYRRTPRAMDVGFVFGVLGAQQLTGAVVVRMLAPLGLSESASRNLLTRMVDQGSLAVQRSGRRARYQLAGGALARYREIEGTDVATPWRGRFHAVLYEIAERHREVRDRFRYLLAYAGYGALRAGVLIAPLDRRERVQHLLPDLPSGCRIFEAELVPAGLEEAQRMAASAWDLDALADRYRAASRLLDRAPEVWTGDVWSGLVAWRDLYTQLYDVQLSDPHLPPQLLAPDWPGADFTARRDDLARRWAPRLQPRLRHEARALDPDGLCRFGDSLWRDGDGRLDP